MKLYFELMQPLFFPDHVGYPINEVPGTDEYVLFEIHYDNPDSEKGVTFEAGVNIYHTAEERFVDYR